MSKEKTPKTALAGFDFCKKGFATSVSIPRIPDYHRQRFLLRSCLSPTKRPLCFPNLFLNATTYGRHLHFARGSFPPFPLYFCRSTWLSNRTLLSIRWPGVCPSLCMILVWACQDVYCGCVLRVDNLPLNPISEILVNFPHFIRPAASCRWSILSTLRLPPFLRAPFRSSRVFLFLSSSFSQV